MKNKVFSLVGILAITLVFGLTVVGCATFEAMAASNEARQTDGKGGTVTVSNTDNSSAYYVVGPGRDGTYSSRTSYCITSGFGKPFNVDNDGSYFVYYRRVRDGESITTVPRDENFQGWNSKSVYISNDEAVRVNIP